VSAHSETRAREIKTHIMQIRHEQRSMIASLSAHIAQLESEERSKVAQLTKAHEREKAEFAEECEKREFLARFAKPSPQLLQLRMMQKHLALTRDFEGAKAAKARADKLQVAESVVASKRAMDSVRLLYRKLLEKQQREIIGANENSRRKIAKVRAEIQQQNDAFAKLLRQLESKAGDARARKLPPLQSPKLVVPRPANGGMMDFRMAVELPQLQVRIDMRRILTKVGK
jgi:aminoglycoside phosphotransferase